MRQTLLVWTLACGISACASDARGVMSAAGNTAVATLPAAFKGYELYAWTDGAALAFTLMTGTNRLKTAAEVQSAPERNDEVVIVRGRGSSELRTLLARVPQGSDVAFVPLRDLPPLSPSHTSEVAAALSGDP